MSVKQSKQQALSRADKRARFSGEQEKRTGASPIVLIVGIIAVLALIGGTVFMLSRPSSGATASAASSSAPESLGYATGSQGLLVTAATEGHDPYPLAVAENGAVRLPLSTFDDGQAHFYTYIHEGRPIEFFVLKSKDGVVRAAFNACDVCFPAKKGYHQEGDEMVCDNCGSRFPSNLINEVRGGCNPSPLDRSVEGDTLVIQVGDIVGGLDYF